MRGILKFSQNGLQRGGGGGHRHPRTPPSYAPGFCVWKHSSLMVSAVGPVSNPGQGNCLVLGTLLFQCVSPCHEGVQMGTEKFNAEGVILQ